jgi:hypothetical protein
MANPQHFCPQCGTPNGPESRFCRSCGISLAPGKEAPGAGGEDTATRLTGTVTSAMSNAESALQQAGSLLKSAEAATPLVIRPPAQWKVVVGDLASAKADNAVREAVGNVIQRGQEKVKTEIERKMDDVPAGTPPPVQHSPAGSGTLLSCPSCGGPVHGREKFCGSCGAKLVAPAPGSKPAGTAGGCPACGAPTIPGKKFCGSCGAKLSQSSPVPQPDAPAARCPACGAPTTPGKGFCGSCGAKQ